MMTHHTWIWDVKNISKEPLEQIFYYIIGDTPKSFGDLNLSVKDENDNNLEIISLDVNKPHEKKRMKKESEKTSERAMCSISHRSQDKTPTSSEASSP